MKGRPELPSRASGVPQSLPGLVLQEKGLSWGRRAWDQEGMKTMFLTKVLDEGE